jgi:ribosomal protein S18 acetylase RimI-like enzyme
MTEEKSISSLQIGSVSIDDFNSIMAFEKEVFGDDAWSEKGMKTELLENPDGFIIARNQEEIIGYSAFQIGYRNLKSLTGPETDGLISSLAVSQSYRRLGLGELLMVQSITRLKQMEAQRIILHTRTDNKPMQILSKKLGFIATGNVTKQSADDTDSLEMVLE